MRYYGFVDYDDLGDLSIRTLVSLRKLIDNELQFRDEALRFELNSDDPPTVVRFLEAAIVLNEERERQLDFMSRRQGLKPQSQQTWAARRAKPQSPRRRYLRLDS